MTLCKRCIHRKVCGIRDCYDKDDERALTACADFFEIVRCKDCKNYLDDTAYCQKYKKGYCRFDLGIKTKKHFCADGERKDGADNE